MKFAFRLNLCDDKSADYNRNLVPFEYTEVYRKFLNKTKRTSWQLMNGWLIEGFVPRQLLENETVIVFFFSFQPIPKGNCIGLEFHKSLFIGRKDKIPQYVLQKEGYYVKSAPKLLLKVIH